MLKNSSLNSIYFFVSLVLLSLLWFNVSFYSSSVIGSLTLLIYIIVVGSWIGRLLFSQDNRLSQQLFGIVVVVCWIIVSEGILVVFKVFTSESFILPLFILLLVLQISGLIIDRRIPNKLTQEYYAITKERYGLRDFIPMGIFVVGFLGSLFSALYVRNDSMMFSLWEVIPFYFWIFMFITLISFVFLQKRVKTKPYGFEISMVCSFLIAFLFFGLMVIVAKISFDPDIWSGLAIVRVIFNLGGRDPTGGLILTKSGYHAFLVTFAKSMGTTFASVSVQWVTWLWSPLMASIYIPFITYQFLKRFYSGDKFSHVFFLGAIGFMLFPIFWLMSVSGPEMVGDILMYVNLFFITIFLSDVKPYRGLFLMVLTTIAAYLVHPISGTFALMADLVAISFHRKIWKMEKLRYIFLAITAILALSLFPSEFTLIQEFLYKGAPFQLVSISFEKIANFWFSPIWLPNLWTADSIVSENFNWVRYVLLIFGLLALRPLKGNDKERIKAWLILTIIVFWVSWFITVNGIGNLPFGTHRFARCLDLALLPLASLILYKLSKIDSLSFIIDGNIKTNKVIKIAIKLKKHRLHLVFLKNKISAVFMLSLIIVGMLSSFYIAYSVSSLPKSYPAEPGRPTWRTVTGDEMKIVQYINKSSEGENYFVLGYGFIPKLVAGNLGYKSYYGIGPNVATGPGTVSDLTEVFMRNPSLSIIYSTMVRLNSSVAFVVLEDWYIKRYSITEDKIETIRSTASEWKVYGENYRFFVFKYDLDVLYTSFFKYILPIDEPVEESVIVIADDESEGFWEIISSYGSGNMGVPQIEFDNSAKLSGSESTRIVIGYGNYGTVGLVHFYDGYQNWSDAKYISLFIYGSESWATINVYLGCPDSSNSLIFSFTDFWEGWRWVKVPFEDFNVVRGYPDRSMVDQVAIFFNFAQNTTILFDRFIVDVS